MEIKKVNLDELTIDDAYVEGGSFSVNAGTYNGNWYQANATDKDGNEYKVIWTNVNWDTEDEENACNWESPDYLLDEYGYECDFGRPPYSKDDFEEMIRDWKANNAEETENLEIDNPEYNEDAGRWEAVARDDETTYLLTDDGTGNIVINYIGTR